MDVVVVEGGVASVVGLVVGAIGGKEEEGRSGSSICCMSLAAVLAWRSLRR